VAGGEIALLEVSHKIESKILKNALRAPFRRLVQNSGMDYGDIRELMAGRKYPFGIDVTDGKVKNLIKAGIIDPVLVVKTALQNAVSIACAVLTTDTLITDLPPKE